MDRHGRPEVQILKGKTVEDKLKSVENVMRRLMRRGGNRTAVVIPPIPISGYSAGGKGVISKQLFPVSGRISHVYINIDEIKQDEGRRVNSTDIDITLKGSKYTKGVSMTVKAGKFDGSVDVYVEAGDQFTISSSEDISGLSYALLFIVDKEKCDVSSVIADVEKEMVEKVIG